MIDITDKCHRISLSNIYKPGSDRVCSHQVPGDEGNLNCGKARRPVQVTAMGQQVYMGHVSSKWSILVLDLVALLRAEGDTPYKAVARLQFCANMRVRGAFTSHLKCV